MIKLIASDLDGTLLLNGAQTLQADTCELIHRLYTEKGIIFVASSGRQYDNLQRLFAPVKDEIAYICENGCLCFYKDELLGREYMDHDLCQRIMRDIKSRPGEEILLSGVHTSYVCPKDPAYLVHMRDVVKNNVTPVDDIFATEEPYFKVSVCTFGGRIDSCTDHYKEAYGDQLNVVTGGSIWLDMMPKHVNKKTAMEVLLHKLSIAPEECVAFGDNYNDLEMLSFAGMPVTVDSAVPGVYDFCDRHTDTVEHALEKILRDEFV